MSLRRFDSVIFSLTLIVTSAVTAPASARTVEPGTVSIRAGVGPGFGIANRLNLSPAYFVVELGAEYDIMSSVGVIFDASLGLGNDTPLRFRPGAIYRLDLGWPVNPYVQAQLSIGRVFGVLGANLTYFGVRPGVGVDYFLTADFAAGATLAYDLGTTFGARPAFLSTFEAVVYARYAFVP